MLRSRAATSFEHSTRVSPFFLLFPLLQALNISSTGNATSLTIRTERHAATNQQTLTNPTLRSRGVAREQHYVYCELSHSHTKYTYWELAKRVKPSPNGFSFVLIFRFLDFISHTICKVGLWKKGDDLIVLFCKMHDADICKIEINSKTPCMMLLVIKTYVFNYFTTLILVFWCKNNRKTQTYSS